MVMAHVSKQESIMVAIWKKKSSAHLQGHRVVVSRIVWMFLPAQRTQTAITHPIVEPDLSGLEIENGHP